MSATFTLPVTAGHGHIHSSSRSHQRHRASSRLAPPFALPRIPSESIVHQTQTPHSHDEDKMDHHHSHNSSTFSSNHVALAPALDTSSGVVVGKGKDSKSGYAPPAAAYRPPRRVVSKPTSFLLPAHRKVLPHTWHTCRRRVQTNLLLHVAQPDLYGRPVDIWLSDWLTWPDQ